MQDLINTFVLLFVVIDPLGQVPLFIALTRGADPAARRRMAWRGCILAGVILLVFAGVGEPLLAALGIGLPAFRIAGGILLFLLAVDMVFARQSGLRSATPSEHHEAMAREDISVFPLAFPLIAGPGAITTILLLLGAGAGAARYALVLAVLGVVLALTLAALLSAERIMRLMGETGTNVVSRVLGLLLAALAVQFILDGIAAVI